MTENYLSTTLAIHHGTQRQVPALWSWQILRWLSESGKTLQQLWPRLFIR